MIMLYGMVSPQQRPTFMGVMIGISQIGLIAGPLIGGSLTQYSTWRWCFWINLPVGGCACILLALIYIPEQMVKPRFTAVLTDRDILKKLDVVGSIILISAVVQLLLALHFGGAEHSWNSPTIIGLFCGFAAATILFMGWEYRAAENAIMPPGLFQNKVLAFAVIMNLCLYGSTYITTYFIPIYFQSILGDSPMMSGIHMLPSIIGSIIFTSLSGTIVSKAIVAVQAKLPPSLIAIALTILIFIQGLGASVVVSIGNTVFDRTVMSEIKMNAPKLDPKEILNAGATAFRSQVPPEDLPDVINSWALGFQKTMFIGMGLSVAMVVFALGLGYDSVRMKNGRAVQPTKQNPQD
ncbi:hypothetical protein DHEL01_v202282 [Diaporthe helianthi]|uniref:Major facilitator superfamily (MFS) profile domain-containing protein n=1 Tax=Diaporthe helianthi TaxID=158607 RepID=A0A2P5I9X6_DIAHE|nr:hypothetical protein DHEL01_v202282 [Diaporthe helianthi]